MIPYIVGIKINWGIVITILRDIYSYTYTYLKKI